MGSFNRSYDCYFKIELSRYYLGISSRKERLETKEKQNKEVTGLLKSIAQPGNPADSLYSRLIFSLGTGGHKIWIGALP